MEPDERLEGLVVRRGPDAVQHRRRLRRHPAVPRHTACAWKSEAEREGVDRPAGPGARLGTRPTSPTPGAAWRPASSRPCRPPRRCWTARADRRHPAGRRAAAGPAADPRRPPFRPTARPPCWPRGPRWWPTRSRPPARASCTFMETEYLPHAARSLAVFGPARRAALLRLPGAPPHHHDHDPPTRSTPWASRRSPASGPRGWRR